MLACALWLVPNQGDRIAFELFLGSGGVGSGAQILLGSADLSGCTGDQPRVDVLPGELLGQLGHQRVGARAGFGDGGDQRLGLVDPFAGGGQRDIQPAVEQVHGVAVVGVAQGGAPINRSQVGRGGFQARVADGLEGVLIQLMCASASQGVDRMELGADQLFTQMLHQPRKVGGMPGRRFLPGERRGRALDQ